MHLSKRIVIFYALAMAAVLAYGVIGAYTLGQGSNFNVKIGSWGDALYFTISTISTVGYGDIIPVTTIAKDFVIILIVSGLTIFLGALTVLSGDFLGSKVEQLYTGVTPFDRRRFKNHVVLIGFNTINQLVAEDLKREKRNFTIIVAERSTADELRKKGYPVFVGDYTLKGELARFNLEKASDIVIDLKDNSKTVYVVLIVRKIITANVKLSVVAPTPEAESHLSDLGVTNIISPMRMAADQLAKVLGKARR